MAIGPVRVERQNNEIKMEASMSVSATTRQHGNRHALVEDVASALSTTGTGLSIGAVAGLEARGRFAVADLSGRDIDGE